jgi:hypothetical protein
VLSEYHVYATAVALSVGFIVWCWVKFPSVVRTPGVSLSKKLIGTLSVLALSLSWVVLALLFIAPARALGIRGHEYHFGPFVLGCGAAVVAGLFAWPAPQVVRRPLGLGSGALFILWLYALNG